MPSFKPIVDGHQQVHAELQMKNNPDAVVLDSVRVRGGGVEIEDVSQLALLPKEWLKVGLTIIYDKSTGERYTPKTIPADDEPVEYEEYKVGGDDTFNGNRTVTRSGLPAVNAGGQTVMEFLENFFFPALPPVAAINGGGIRQFGASPAVTLNWTATKRTNPITEIIVAGQAVTPTGNTQSGSRNTATPANTNTTFSIVVKAGADQGSDSTTVSYQHKRYWGRINKNSGITDADILALTGAGVGGGNEFATSRAKTYNNLNGAGQYLIFAFPQSFGTPQFKVNGLANTAFTRVRNDAFVNSDGYSEPYQLWLSNTVQNSPLNVEIS